MNYAYETVYEFHHVQIQSEVQLVIMINQM